VVQGAAVACVEVEYEGTESIGNVDCGLHRVGVAVGKGGLDGTTPAPAPYPPIYIGGAGLRVMARMQVVLRVAAGVRVFHVKSPSPTDLGEPA